MSQMLEELSKTSLSQCVVIRLDRNMYQPQLLEETIKDAFFESPDKISLDLEFTDKVELKVWIKPKKQGDEPLFLFPMCYHYCGRKDVFICITIRGENDSPIPINMVFVRNLLITFKIKEIKYEIW